MMLVDKAIHGRSKNVLDQLVSSALHLIDVTLDAGPRLKALETDPTTFEYLNAELARRRKVIRLRGQ